MIIMYKKLLLGIDDSENSMKAVEKVLEMQKESGAEVVIFHSVLHHISDLRPSFGFNSTPDGNLTYEVQHDRAKQEIKLLADIKKKFKDSGFEVDARIIYDLGPQYYIENKVKEENFDLVVLGCKGEHSILRRTILGTIPEYIINHVNVDVLIAK